MHNNQLLTKRHVELEDRSNDELYSQVKFYGDETLVGVLFSVHTRHCEIDDRFFECKLGAGISPESKFNFLAVEIKGLLHALFWGS